MPPEWLAFATAIIANMPVLDGAACVGLAPGFDGPGGYGDVSVPLAICGHCPARAACRAWVETLEPAQRPIGIIAGQVIRASRGSVPTGRRRGRPPRTRVVA